MAPKPKPPKFCDRPLCYKLKMPGRRFCYGHSYIPDRYVPPEERVNREEEVAPARQNRLWQFISSLWGSR